MEVIRNAKSAEEFGEKVMDILTRLLEDQTGESWTYRRVDTDEDTA